MGQEKEKVKVKVKVKMKAKVRDAGDVRADLPMAECLCLHASP